MPTKDERRAEAEKHVSLMKALFSKETQATVDSARIFEDGEGRDSTLPEPQAETTEVAVERCNAVDALYAVKGRATVVDQAAFTRPGGGYLVGAFGPEQVLCAESNLYNVLAGLKAVYFDKNKQFGRGMLFTDRALLLQGVTFMRNGSVLEADVVAAAAPNRTRALENNRAVEECDADLARRVETIMRIAAQAGNATLVLGDFGCGQGNAPEQVATLFRTWLDAHSGVFADIVFAIPGGPALDVFRTVFGVEAPQARPKPDRIEEDEAADDEESWEDIDLPEGVTIR